MDHNKLKKEIIRKMRHFHSRRYLHERIISWHDCNCSSANPTPNGNQG
jgi:hypothetical protein